MAELEVAGIKFRGGKIFLVLTALTTAGGGLGVALNFIKTTLT